MKRADLINKYFILCGRRYLGNSIGPLSISVFGAVEKFLTQNTILNEGTEYTSRQPSSRQSTHQSVAVGGVSGSSEGGWTTSMLLLD